MNSPDPLSSLEQRIRQGRRQARWLLLLVLVLGALSTLWAVTNQQQRLLTDMQAQGDERLELYASTLEAAVARYEYLPYLTATDHEVLALLADPSQEEDQATLNRKLKRWQQASGASVLYVMDASGKVVASSNFDTAQSFLDQDYHFRPYFRDAMAGRPGRFFAIGFTTGLPGFFLSFPVQVNDQRRGVAVVKLDLTSLEKNWAAGGESVLVADRDSVVFLASQADWKYQSLEPLDESIRLRLKDQHKYSGQRIGQLPLNRLIQADTSLPVLETAQDEWLLMPRELELLDGTLYYLASLQPLRGRVRDAALMGIMATILMGLLATVWMLRRASRRESRINAARLAHSAAEQRQIIKDTQAGLLTTDEQFHITFANPTAIDIFARQLDSFTGTRLSQYLRQHDGGECAPALLQQSRDIELQVLRPDGTPVAVFLSSRPLGKQSARGFLITIHDITELKAAENALRDAHDELEQRVDRRTRALNEANRQLQGEVRERVKAEEELVRTQQELIQTAKLAALGQMSAGIVHEINQPLAAIHTYLSSARLLLQRGEHDLASDNLAEIQNLVRRMNTLISHLKGFASRSDGKLKPVNLDHVISNTLILMKPRLDKSVVQPRMIKPDVALWVIGDEIRLEQVLVNLLRNALDAVDGVSNPQVTLHLDANNEQVEVRVSDNGPGIVSSDLSKIFDPFFTTKDVGKGMGLGLSVSYGIAREMGGQLSVANLREGGARFTLSLMSATPGQQRVAS